MADQAGAPPRAWQRMLSGRRLDLLDPSPLDVEIADIAHGLARVARWNGQTQRRPRLLGGAALAAGRGHLLHARRPTRRPTTRLAALLHDAPEYVIGDMISPFKSVVGGGYKAVEQRLQRAIHLRFALPPRRARATAQGRSSGPTRSPPISRRRSWPASRWPRRRRFFGRPRGISADRFDLSCKPAKARRRISWSASQRSRSCGGRGRIAKAGGRRALLPLQTDDRQPRQRHGRPAGGATSDLWQICAADRSLRGPSSSPRRRRYCSTLS